jgi:hypothetical protein
VTGVVCTAAIWRLSRGVRVGHPIKHEQIAESYKRFVIKAIAMPLRKPKDSDVEVVAWGPMVALSPNCVIVFSLFNLCAHPQSQCRRMS